MDWTDEAYVLAARAHGESAAIVDLLTETHGRLSAWVAGGASRRMKPTLQPGTPVQVRWRARLDQSLGSATLEPSGPGIAGLLDDPLALAGLNAAASVTSAVLPEHEAAPGAYAGLSTLMAMLWHETLWPYVYIRYELGLLDAIGFGLDLSRCASTGSFDDLAYVSPRTGRAVSLAAAAPYVDKLLPLPAFLLASQAGVRDGDLKDGLALTGFFLEKHVFHALNRPLPPARVWMTDLLTSRGYL